tara:strand:+ start:9523 stop:9672 length:150 start_codon:yes stop_codon:yes gene_type:complete
MEINIEKNKINGSLVLSALVDDNYFKMVFYYHTISEAKRLFKKEIKKQK